MIKVRICFTDNDVTTIECNHTHYDDRVAVFKTPDELFIIPYCNVYSIKEYETDEVTE